MANYQQLKNALVGVIKQNGNNEITGEIMQTTLLSMINSLGANYQFAGILTPSTTFVTPDENVFFIGGGGTYNNFGTNQIVVPNGGIGFFMYNGSYTYSVLQNDGVFDISVYHAAGGTPSQYADLAAALGTNGVNVPDGIRKGGMSVKFIQSSDNKYVQYRLMADTFSTTESDWQGVDDVPTAGSGNLVTSGGVYTSLAQINGGTIILDKSLCTIQGSVIDSQGKADVVTRENYYHSDYISIDGIDKLTLIAPVDSNTWGAALYTDDDESSFLRFIPYTQTLQEYDTNGAKFIRFSNVDASWFGDTIITLYAAGEIAELTKEVDYVGQYVEKNFIAHSQWTPQKYIGLDGTIQSISSNIIAVSDLILIKYASVITVNAHGWSYANHIDYAFYDAEGIFISGGRYNSTGEVKQEINIPDGAVYFRASSQRDSAVYSGDVIYTFSNKSIRNNIQIGGEDGYSFIEGMKLAMEKRNCDVTIKPGIYDISSDIPTLYAQNSGGIVIGGNNKYFFEGGSKVICNYSGSDTGIIETFSPFVAEQKPTSGGNNIDFEIIGLNLECTNLRYCIHDEEGGYEQPEYKHIYKNCFIKGHDLRFNACIGGGLGYKAYIEIDGCTFVSDGESQSDYPRDVFYHGNYDADLGPNSRYALFIKNNYFNDGFTLIEPNRETEKNYCLYTGNSAARDIVYISDYWNVYKGVNEIRNV